MGVTIDSITEPNSLAERAFLASAKTVHAIGASYISGFVLGAAGRLSNFETIVAAPVAVDVFNGTRPDAKMAVCYLAYGAGVATAYADKVGSAVASIADKF